MADSSKKKKGRVKGFFADFKAFISKGNILDMAIGVIIGGAFGKIVTSLVNDIIMPLITLLVGGKSIEDWKWVITEASDTAAESALNYGLFLQSIIDFLIIAFFIFLALRLVMNFKSRMSKEENGMVVLTKEERKSLKKELRVQGHSKKEIEMLIDQKEEELTAAREAEERAAAEAEAVTTETSEDILKDIRDLLKNNKIGLDVDVKN